MKYLCFDMIQKEYVPLVLLIKHNQHVSKYRYRGFTQSHESCNELNLKMTISQQLLYMIKSQIVLIPGCMIKGALTQQVQLFKIVTDKCSGHNAIGWRIVFYKMQLCTL